MQRNVIALSVLLLCFSEVAGAHRAPAASNSPSAENQAIVTSESNCDAPSGAQPQPTARFIAVQDENALDAHSPAPAGGPDSVAAKEAVFVAADLEKDLHFLSAKESALSQCMLAQVTVSADQDFHGACGGQLLLNFEMRHNGEIERDIPIGHFAGNSAFFYESGMTIDADGAPNAYHPGNLGLDDLANAGAPGRWKGWRKTPTGSRSFREKAILFPATTFRKRRSPIIPKR